MSPHPTSPLTHAQANCSAVFLQQMTCHYTATLILGQLSTTVIYNVHDIHYAVMYLLRCSCCLHLILVLLNLFDNREPVYFFVYVTEQAVINCGSVVSILLCLHFLLWFVFAPFSKAYCNIVAAVNKFMIENDPTRLSSLNYHSQQMSKIMMHKDMNPDLAVTSVYCKFIKCLRGIYLANSRQSLNRKNKFPANIIYVPR